jgi:hypothetical protein
MSSRIILSRVLPISSLILIVLFKFQNCAPVNPSDAKFVGTGDSEVRIVDRWGESQVSFLTASITVPNDQPPPQGVQGLCVGSAKGQMIEYQVIEIKEIPEVVSAGVVECVRGGFELPLAQVHFSSCSSRLQVRATRQGDSETYAETFLQPDCAAGS